MMMMKSMREREREGFLMLVVNSLLILRAQLDCLEHVVEMYLPYSSVPVYSCIGVFHILYAFPYNVLCRK